MPFRRGDDLPQRGVMAVVGGRRPLRGTASFAIIPLYVQADRNADATRRPHRGKPT